MTLAPGTRLGPYEIVALLGAGGMGEVYRARDTKLARDVALKILPDSFAADPDRRGRFEREARTIAALNHPNIVTIYSVEECARTPFLTMEIVEGRTIDSLVPPRGLPLSDLLAYAIPLVDAVGAAHHRQIVHRDLKPSNVMVTRDGRVKVLDFGLAKVQPSANVDEAAQTATAARATSIGQIVGTTAYMSPEQAEGRPVDHRSDIFSLGILLYEMATGVRPFSGDTTLALLSSIIKDTPKPITEIRPHTSRDLDRIIERCLPGRAPTPASSSSSTHTTGRSPPSVFRRRQGGRQRICGTGRPMGRRSRRETPLDNCACSPWPARPGNRSARACFPGGFRMAAG